MSTRQMVTRFYVCNSLGAAIAGPFRTRTEAYRWSDLMEGVHVEEAQVERLRPDAGGE